MNRFVLTLISGLLVPAAAMAQASTSGASSSNTLARELNHAFGDVYEKVSPGVVVIEAKEAAGPNTGPSTPLMQFFLQDPDARRGSINQGSGFIMTTDGYIMTNSHVLEGARADGLRVTLKDGRKFEAKVVGIDPTSDLAVLKINASGLPIVEFGNSDKARVGEFAFALGAPYDLRYTFTYGIISAKGRTDLIPGHHGYEEYLQTDASINPGNSGGPLVDIEGRVIGVNTMIYGIDQGLGFAIPINIAKKVASQLIANGRAIRAWLGIWIKDASEMRELVRQYANLPNGIFVADIVAGTPASQSELRPADVIIAIDGVSVSNPRELQKVIFEKQVGEEVELQVWRANRTVKIKLRTAEQAQQGAMPVMHQRMPSIYSNSQDDEEGEPAAPAPPQAADSSPRSSEAHPSAGLELRSMTADLAIKMKLQAQEGVLVTSVQPGSLAAAAGVKVGDVITSVASTPVRTKQDFINALANTAEGEAVLLNLNRGEEKTYAILKK